MRKVTQQIAAAFMARKSKTIGNTHTDGESIWLHGNEIVRRNESGEIEISLAGWPTVTTRERLTPFANVCQRKGEQYLNGYLQIDNLRGWYPAVPPMVKPVRDFHLASTDLRIFAGVGYAPTIASNQPDWELGKVFVNGILLERHEYTAAVFNYKRN